jgi:hypothetical protein
MEKCAPDENGILILYPIENNRNRKNFDARWSYANESQWRDSGDRMFSAVTCLLVDMGIALDQAVYDPLQMGPKLQEWLEKNYPLKYRIFMFRNKEKLWMSDVENPLQRNVIYMADDEGEGFRPIRHIYTYKKRQDWCEFCDVNDILHLHGRCPYLNQKYQKPSSSTL